MKSARIGIRYPAAVRSRGIARRERERSRGYVEESLVEAGARGREDEGIGLGSTMDDRKRLVGLARPSQF
jgi:hypothetical protein